MKRMCGAAALPSGFDVIGQVLPAAMPASAFSAERNVQSGAACPRPVVRQCGEVRLKHL
jgi:hypothetical protein